MKKLKKLFLLLLFALPAFGQSSAGIISSARSTDWSKAGIPGGIPSGSWTQCGATMPNTSTAAQINTRLASCSANQYVFLGPGVFNLTAAIVISNGTMKRFLALRGSGADVTFLVFSSTGFVSCSGGTGNASICVGSSDTNFATGPPANICDVSAPIAQNATTLTLSGSCNMGNFVANQTMIQLDQADDGYQFPDNSFTIATSQLTSNVATITTSATNNLSSGQNVWIKGARSGFNVDTTLTEPITVVNGTTFTFPISHADIALATEASASVEGLSSGHSTDNGGFFNASDKFSTKVDISAVTCGGGNATYTYVYNTGFQFPTNAVSPIFPTESIVITGLGNAGNNGTLTIGSRALGTFTAPNAGCVPATTQAGTGVAGGTGAPVTAGRTSNGPAHVNQRLHRNQNETFLVTGIAGNVITLNAPVVQPNWSLGQSPQVWLAQAVTFDGVEDLSIDVSAITTPNSGILFGNACYDWVKGVRLLSARTYGLYGNNVCNLEWKNNYLYRTGQDGGYGDAGAFKFNGSHNLIENNIAQRSTNVVFFEEGPTVGNVIAYNFGTTYVGNGGNNLGGVGHATSRGNLYEGNQLPSLESSDGVHGSTFGETFFRNSLWGWMNCSNGMCGGGTTALFGGFALVSRAGGRYPNIIANVLQTPNLTGSYAYEIHGTCGSFHCAIGLGLGNTNINEPDDSLSWLTATRWGNWDVSTNNVRWCGNSSSTGWASPCSSTSEIPTGDAFFPNSVPTLGDVAAGQGALPASFYLSSKPAWVGSRPWPLIGPDVTGGNVKQCPGTQDAVGLQSRTPATDASSCAGAGAPTAAWGGHVNANPAMDVYLNTMGGLPDGSGPALAFNENYYNSASPAVLMSPASLAFGNTVQSNPSSPQTTTLTNTGGANLTITSFAASSDYSVSTSPSCNSGCTVAAGGTVVATVTFTPAVLGADNGTLSVVDNATGTPHTVALTGTGIVNPAGTGAPQGSLIGMVWSNDTHTFYGCTPCNGSLCCTFPAGAKIPKIIFK